MASTVNSNPSYGEWESPITPSFITTAGVGLDGVTISPTGALFWLEGRPNEGGRYVCVRHSPGDPKASERDAVDVNPEETNVRTRVHEYGGASFLIAKDPTASGEETVFYANFKDQRIYKVRAGILCC